MQVIGIFLKDGDERVIKSLKRNEWYSLGNFVNCHDIFIDNPNKLNNENSEIQKQITVNKSFINQLYQLNSSKTKPSINLNCIVGKNGSGKSSLLSLEYRIINNLSCKIKEQLPEYNKDYEPIWATGFDAELYYEIDGKINVIKICRNKTFRFDEEYKRFIQNNPTKKPEIKLYIDGEDLFSKVDNSELLQNLGNNIFYTVGTNYTLFMNSYVTDSWNNKKEEWLYTLYHKNDGYFTPIVLVPYRYNSTIIDTEKELSLANERVITLSLLLYNQNKRNSFIKDLWPEKIEYQLIKPAEYEKIIRKKYLELIKYKENYKIESYDQCEEQYSLNKLRNTVNKIWKKKILLINEDLDKDIINNVIKYLTFKIIKMSRYYDSYMSYFSSNGIFADYADSKKQKGCINSIRKIIDQFFVTHTTNNKNGISLDSVDFSNLKIHQCLKFIEKENYNYYIKEISKYEVDLKNNLYELREKPISELSRKIFHKVNQGNKNTIINRSNILSYDSFYINLIPPFMKRRYLYKKEGENELVDLTSLSSGEQQFLYSLSYVIYHMKNVASNQNVTNRIKYKNINLVFDEAELYYHPEYQQEYIGKIIDILNRGNFSRVFNSINITLVTHSPFLLSDIPNSNILALEKGEINKTLANTKTLCANYYDLLKNQFILRSSIGKLAEKWISELVNDNIEYEKESDNEYKERIKSKYITNKTFYKSLYNAIGDEYLKNLLYDILYKFNVFSIHPNTQKKINEYQAKIDQLKKEVEEQ